MARSDAQTEDAAAPTAAGVFGRERRALTLGILISIATFAADGMGVVPALPTAVRALGGLPLFGWAFSVFMLAWLVGTIAAGQLADERGPHPPMALGLAAFGGGLLLAAAARGMTLFLAGRALQGLGGGAIIAAAYVAIARGYPDALRARMMALTASVWIVPAVVGPALSGAIAERWSWRLVFAGVVPFLVVAALLVLPPMRPFAVRRPPAAASRVPLALRLALGTGLALAAPDLRRYGPAPAIVVGVVGLVLLLPALRALLPAGTLVGRRGLPMGLALRGLIVFSFFGTEAFVPLGAGELRGASPTRAGLALTAGALGWIAASWTQDRLEALGGAASRARRVGIGCLLMAIGIALTAVTLVTGLPFLFAPLGWAIGGAGIGLAYGSGGLLCIAAAPPGQEGEVSGQLQLAEALGTSAATGAGGALLAFVRSLGHGPRPAHASVFALTLSVALLAATFAGRVAARPPGSPSDGDAA